MISKQTLTAVAVLGISPWFATTAWSNDSFPFAAEVDSCVETINRQLDLGAAHRVRHLISKSKRTGIGYVLSIETSVISDAAERKYESRCVVNGSNPPLKFRMDELDT